MSRCVAEDRRGVRCSYGLGHPLVRHRFGPTDVDAEGYAYLREIDADGEAGTQFARRLPATVRKLFTRGYLDLTPLGYKTWAIRLTPDGRRVLADRPA